MPDGARLLLTRPEAQADDWARRMAALGVPTASLPLIDIAATDDPAPAQAAWAALDETDLAMFVSPNAVRHFFDRRPAGKTWPSRTWAATVGPGSAQALAEHGVPAARIVQPPPGADSLDSEHLWPELWRVLDPVWGEAPGHPGGAERADSAARWAGRRALLVRGDGGREWLGDRLREAGMRVDAVGVYRRGCPRLDVPTRALLRRALASPASHVWLFSSSEAIGHLEALEQGTREGGPAPDWRAVRAVATHERIAARAQALGVGHVVLVRPDAPAVAAAFRMLSGSTLESRT
ncbi:MAG: uroporphyrinogen-III synthase [Mitsuaria chitosanitabida]|jgi:uroporphyrinogen-III synthase|uniref:uroporphyrinogen-III synthase n=1 Tax=Roseateles chitosanitabidus TaxID=65048 RepID=UPI001B1B9B51|nr:uroporphyrinogen-III synthase [Roseateles chitosanitabidus]MBO9686443.1 uroporphyrinogen-III synthase [Roseateles chitosanitabidus]